MAEYIDRDAAITEQKRFCGYLDNDMLYRLEIATRRIPAADVRPVVLCRDCYWWTKQETSMQGRCSCLGMYPTGNWYCANGQKRREES